MVWLFFNVLSSSDQYLYLKRPRCILKANPIAAKLQSTFLGLSMRHHNETWKYSRYDLISPYFSRLIVIAIAIVVVNVATFLYVFVFCFYLCSIFLFSFGKMFNLLLFNLFCFAYWVNISNILAFNYSRCTLTTTTPFISQFTPLVLSSFVIVVRFVLYIIYNS